MGKSRASKNKKYFRKSKRMQRSSTTIKETGNSEVDDFLVNTDKCDQKKEFHEVVRAMLLGGSTFEQHIQAQDKNSMRYAATLAVMEQSGVALSQSSRPRVLAAAFARRDKDLVSFLLSLKEEKIGVKEVLKAVTLLDARRAIKAHNQQLKRLQDQPKTKPRKIAILKSLIASAQIEIATKGGITKFVVRHVKQWIKSIAEERFIFYASHFPTEPWRKLADLCHLHPDKDFPQCKWFLRFCFGDKAPEGSVVNKSIVIEGDISKAVMETDIDYSVVRQHCSASPNATLTDEAKARIATYTKNIDTLIWYYEELACSAVNEIIAQRLRDGEKLKLTYGKLMERLLTFGVANRDNKEPPCFVESILKQAEERLKEINVSLESPVAVLGDRSSSMHVAIKTSNIIASLLTVVCNASMKFFDTNCTDPPFLPKTAKQVIELSEIVREGGSTSPAAALMAYYKPKTMVKTFVIVTDEEENTSCENMRFAPLFEKYQSEVYNAKLVFISFLQSQTESGQMMNALKAIDSDIDVMQFRFNRGRPDLTKLDGILSLLSYRPDVFKKSVDEMEEELLTQKTNNCLNTSNANCNML